MTRPEREEVSPAASAAGDTAAASLHPEGHVPAHASRPLEVAGAVVALVLSTLLYVFAQRIELRTETGGIDPRWWPRTLGMVGIALSLILLLAAVLRAPSEREDIEEATRSGQFRLAAAVALALGYAVVWPLVGFLPTTVVMLAVATWIFGGRGVGALLVIPVALAGSLYLLFSTLLKVPL